MRDTANLPAIPDFGDGWRLGEPDLELSIPEYQLEAADGDRSRNFVLPAELDGPRWVKAVEPNEEIENLVLSWDEALAMIDRREIVDRKTIVALLMYERQRRVQRS